MALCYLLTLYCFIRSAEDSSRRWALLALVACLLGMASKEVMVTAPAMVFLYDRTFLAGSFRAAWRQRWRVHLALASTWLLLAYLMAGGQLAQRGIGLSLGVSPFTYALTECRAILHYLRLAVWPHPLVFDYGWDYVAGLPTAAPYAMGLGALLAGTLFALWRRPALGFAGAWFLGILAPSSSIVPIIQQPVAENRMYLPLAAVTTVGAVGLWCLAGRRSLLAGLAVALVLGGMTVRRNRDYRDELALWTDTVAQRPANARAHNNLGGALLRADRSAEAVAHFESALRLRPGYPDAHNNLGVALARAGRFPEAIAEYQNALRADPGLADAHYNLGNALLQTGQTAGAIVQFEAALRIKPTHANAHNDLSVALLTVGRTAEAIAHAEAALRARPDFAAAHYNLGNALARVGRIPEAIDRYADALRLQPDFARAHNNLGALLLQTGRTAGAIEQFEAALRIQPDYPEARRNLDHARRLQNP